MAIITESTTAVVGSPGPLGGGVDSHEVTVHENPIAGAHSVQVRIKVQIQPHGSNECPICLDPTQDDSIEPNATDTEIFPNNACLRSRLVWNCGHWRHFHKACIRHWFEVRTATCLSRERQPGLPHPSSCIAFLACPICREPICREPICREPICREPICTLSDDSGTGTGGQRTTARTPAGMHQGDPVQETQILWAAAGCIVVSTMSLLLWLL